MIPSKPGDTHHLKSYQLESTQGDPLKQVTPLILTYNEEANIARTLAGLGWAHRIVVIDSFSTDCTMEILAADPRVEVSQRAFDTHAKQWNYGLEQVRTGWVLCLDADYVITPAFVAELRDRLPQAQHKQVKAFAASFRYLVAGRPLSGTVYPAKVVMFQTNSGRYRDDGHTQLAVINGAIHTLRSPIDHDDRKSLRRWLWAQERYHWLEAEKLLQSPIVELGFIDRLRKTTPLAPLFAVLYCLLLKRGLLDGRAGLFYAMQRGYAELQIWLMLQELKSLQVKAS